MSREYDDPRLEAARRIRLKERERYLRANSALPDAEERWGRYELLIREKYGRGKSVDFAWIIRDWAHTKQARRTGG